MSVTACDMKSSNNCRTYLDGEGGKLFAIIRYRFPVQQVGLAVRNSRMIACYSCLFLRNAVLVGGQVGGQLLLFAPVVLFFIFISVKIFCSSALCHVDRPDRRSECHF